MSGLTIVDDTVWCCAECTVFLANGDLSSLDNDPETADARERAIVSGAARRADAGLQWLPAWDSEDGEREHSIDPCECCGDRLHGPRTRWALAADTDTVCVTTGCTRTRAAGRTRCKGCLAKQAERARARRAERASQKTGR
jgi:hypothetical protein